MFLIRRARNGKMATNILPVEGARNGNGASSCTSNPAGKTRHRLHKMDLRHAGC